MERKNTEPLISTYLHQKGRALGLPIAGNFELTARCNFNCPMCYVHRTGDATGELTAAQWLAIARDARDAGMVFALLTGGEPFIRKDFFEIYGGMKELGLMISINSNGSMLTDETVSRLLADPPTRMNISLYGGCDETYRKMCGISAYSAVKENIRCLKSAGIDVSLNLSITPYNRGDLAKIYADAVELGVNVRTSSYMYPPVRINDQSYGCADRLTPEDAAAAAVEWDALRFTPEEFRARAKGAAEAVCEGCPMEEGEGVTCRAGSTSFWVTWDGKMMPCGMMTEPVADPLEAGFQDAWAALRRETAKLRLAPECGGCAYQKLCSVCAAVCLTETGRFDGVPTYMCEKTKAQVRLMQEAVEHGD